MNKILCCLFLFVILFSCSHKKELVYLNDSNNNNLFKLNNEINHHLEFGDILKIDIQTIVPEASFPYVKSENNLLNNIDLLLINGYMIDKNGFIDFPVLGKINTNNLSENEFASKIKRLLIDGGHLTNPHVKVKKINSKFTVLGEVNRPGTYSFYDKNINIFQAIGYAGDLAITAKRNNITLLREENGLRKTYKISLKKTDLLTKPYYVIKNNDIIIIEPNFSKVKSAGFIGSPSSIASISSLLLSITLLIINK